MSTLIFDFAANRGPNDQPLTEAARVALAVDPTPRMMKIYVDQNGLLSEKPEVPQLSQPQE